MKKNKGFTLIELLAIIVILALIAVIISPIILGIIEDSKLSAATDSAYGYKEAIGKYYASQLSQNSDFMLNGEYTIGTDGSISDEENNYPILVSGTIPKSGYVTIEKGAVTAGCIQINEFAVRIEDKKVTSTEKGYCVEPPVVVEEFPQVTDENPGIICGDGDTEDYDNSTVCYIYSVEDLVAFSNMVNSGKNFSGKTVMLMNNLDIQNDKSYANVSSNHFGDVNENSTTSTTLKEELTDETAKGFKPIGNNTNKFTGTFEGNAKTIKKLFINRSNESYVGLFGYAQATIRGLNVIDAEITGYENVGIIAGYSTGSLTSLIARGNISGYRLLGLGSGQVEGGKIETVVSGNITSTYSSSNQYGNVGGITGWAQSGTKIRGIMQSGTITMAGSSSQAYRIMGNGSTNATIYAVASESVVVPSSDNALSNKGGATIASSSINEISVLDIALDTYMGGDKDWDDYSDGYYYDQNDAGEVIIRKVSEYPLEITMDGEGTETNPYIINNYNDLKQATYNLSARYELNTDIDFQNKVAITIGSKQNKFTGVFDGNGHTINNLHLNGYNEVGLFGYNTGTVRGLNVINANVTGNESVGIVVGYNTGRLTSLIARGNVSGYRLLGLGAGQVEGGTIEAVVSGNVTSTYTSANQYGDIGGITGWAQSGTKIRGIMQSGTITVSGQSSQAYRIVGYCSTNATIYAVASESVVVPSNNNTLSNNGGATIKSTSINDISVLDIALDTYIGGDKDFDDYSDGYYYDQNESGTVTIRKVSEYPLEITMEGLGTAESPYIINNYNDLKQAAYSTSARYKLNADIDLANKNQIMLGSKQNKFTGVFDGNAHTINNLNLNGHDNVGLFGYNSGTVKGLNVTNANISGNEAVGIIAGYNTGSLTNLIARGNVSGYRLLGLGAGQVEGGTLEAVVSGNVTSTYTSSDQYGCVGGFTGWAQSGTTIRGIILSGTISMAGENSQAYRIMGNGSSLATISAAASETVVAPSSDEGKNNKGGKTVTAAELQTITPYQEVGLNTSSTSGEYRYELDLNNNPYLVKN